MLHTGAPCQAHSERKKQSTTNSQSLSSSAIRERRLKRKQGKKSDGDSDGEGENEEKQTKKKKKRRKASDNGASPGFTASPSTRTALEEAQALHKKCARCHANNYLQLCPKGTPHLKRLIQRKRTKCAIPFHSIQVMCKVCCPKDGPLCEPHRLKEKMKDTIQAAQILNRERDKQKKINDKSDDESDDSEEETKGSKQPIKFDKNGRRVPMKCGNCLAYNAMKDCIKQLCSVCCKKQSGASSEFVHYGHSSPMDPLI